MLGGEIPNIFELWNPITLRVSNSRDVIFVCGGETALPPALAKSRRDVLMRLRDGAKLKKYTFVLAEDVNVFAPRDNYGDLLRFESDIAQISALVLLFAESAGSFVELGSFAMVPDITERMLVVIDDFFYAQDSFIRWGPIAFLENSHGNEAVYVLNRADVGMGHDGLARDIDPGEFGERMSNAIRQRIATAKDHSTFDKGHVGHVIRFITGLLQDYGALTDDELSLCLEVNGVMVEPRRIKEYMICAEALGWLVRVREGLRHFNVAKDGREALRFEFLKGAAYIDRVRWRADVIEYWKVNDRERSRVIEAARAGA